MEKEAFQDTYEDDHSHCYGCGRLNDHGLQIKSYWDGDETYALFMPEAYHTATRKFVYGGLIASLIDCHCTATAAAAAYRAEGRDIGTPPFLRYVTASLHVDYIRPTPIGVELEIRGTAIEVRERKVVITARVSADGDICATGKVVAVKVPPSMR